MSAPKKRIALVGWKYGVFMAGIFGSVGLALYPIVISPMKHKDEWREYSAAARKEFFDKHGKTVEEIQPANMKVWTDPFDRPGKPGNK